jgi:hypothetical protein
MRKVDKKDMSMRRRTDERRNEERLMKEGMKKDR